MKEKRFPMRFAHRGLVQHAPENTIEAFQAAVDAGCEGIELDIRLSRDGEVIVIHDDSPARLTDGKLKGKVSDLSAEEILKAEIPYAGHLLPYDPPVPYSESVACVAVYTDEEIRRFREEDKRIAHFVTFEMFDRWFSGIREDVTVEIEFCAGGMMKRMYEILSKSDNCSRYILFSGHTDINEEIQSYLREHGKPEGLRLGANIVATNEEQMNFVNGADLYEVGLNDFRFTADDVKMLADKGIKVFSNLGDYPEWWAAMQTLGIEGFKTNYAEAYADWLKNR